MSMFDNADTFLNANSDLFEGLSENDLLVSERLIFTKGEVVQGTILDIGQIDTATFKAIKVEFKVETGDHAGKLHDLIIAKPSVNENGQMNATAKKGWVDFLLALFTKEEILSKQIDLNKHIGARLEFTAGEARSKGERTYQNYNRYKLLAVEDSSPF
jgi:hypothetical protein